MNLWIRWSFKLKYFANPGMKEIAMCLFGGWLCVDKLKNCLQIYLMICIKRLNVMTLLASCWVDVCIWF